MEKKFSTFPQVFPQVLWKTHNIPTNSITGTRSLRNLTKSVILLKSSQFNPMCGPVFEYSFEDYLNDASDEEWDEWERKAAELELPLDYYIQEFV